ncbi:unnamed protein product, partial [Closterium sp. NIES-53]
TPSLVSNSGDGGSGGGQQRQQRQPKTLSSQQPRECVSQCRVLGGVEATSLGAREPASTGAAPTEALHTFTLDSGATRCFFRDCTTVTPLTTLVPITLADPSGGTVVARASIVLPCPAVLSGSLTGFHLPSFAKNLVSTAVLQDQFVTVTTPGGELVAICMDSRTGAHLATFTRRPESGLYTLTTESLPPLPRSLAPPCLPCVEGRQRAAPHSSFPPTTAPLQNLHINVPPSRPLQARQARKPPLQAHQAGALPLQALAARARPLPDRVPPLQAFAARAQPLPDRALPLQALAARAQPLQARHANTADIFTKALPSACFASLDLSCDPLLSPTLPMGRHIGLIMAVARTSMIHATAPHFLWPFAVRYAAHQLNLWPHVSVPETSPTLRWTREVGDASAFRVWGSLALVRDPTTGKLSPRTLLCVFLGLPTNALPWKFYHPATRNVLSVKVTTGE